MTVPTTAPEQAPAPAPTTVGWASVPRVNLLPAELIAARGLRKVQQLLALAVVVTLALIACMFVWAQNGVETAQTELTGEQAKTALLQQEQAKYIDVPKVLGQIDAAQTAEQTAMASDIAWYTYLYDLSTVTPSRVSLTALTATVGMPGATSAQPGTSGPLSTSGVGQVTVAGTAATFSDVAAWLDSIDQVKGLDASMLDTAIREETTKTSSTLPTVSFTTHITVTDDAFTHRYDRKAS